MSDWSVDELKDYLRDQKGRHSNMKKQDLLDLAKLYAQKPKEDPQIAVAYESHFADIVKKRQKFKITDNLSRTNIFEFDIILPPRFVFDQIVVNTFLTCCPIEIDKEVVDTGIVRPANKAKCSK